MKRTEERTREIDAALADIRRIESTAGVTSEGLTQIKERLIRLASRTDLFDPANSTLGKAGTAFLLTPAGAAYLAGLRDGEGRR